MSPLRGWGVRRWSVISGQWAGARSKPGLGLVGQFREVDAESCGGVHTRHREEQDTTPTLSAKNAERMGHPRGSCRVRFPRTRVATLTERNTRSVRLVLLADASAGCAQDDKMSGQWLVGSGQ